jgi:flavodoxin
MARILVTYFTRTGNTKKVAEAIYDELDGDKAMAPLGKVEDLSRFDLVFIGFPVQSHSVPFPVETFLKAVPAGLKVALFSTHGSFTGSPLSRQALEYAAILIAGVRLLGTFSCRGKVSPDALEALKREPEHEAWAEMAASAATHPDEHDLAEARAFARYIYAVKDSGPL